MGIFSRFLPKKEQKALNPNTPSNKPIQGVLTPLSVSYKQDNAYTSLSAVYTVVSYLMGKFANVPIRVYKVSDQKAMKQYKAIQPYQFQRPSNYLKARKLQRKALEQADETSDLARLLQQPSEAFSSDGFFQTLYGFKLLKGEGFIWLNRGEGNEGNTNAPVLEMIPVPPGIMHLVPDPNDAYGILEWVMQLPKLRPIPKEDIILWKYPRFDFDSTTHIHLRGQAPLTAGYYDLEGISAMDAAYKAIFENRGANGILMATELDSTVENVSGVLKAINERINNNLESGNIAGGAGKYDFFNLSMSTREMMLIEAKKFSVTQVAHLYNAPPGIWDLSESANNNITQYREQVYTDKIMGEWSSLLSQLNSVLLPSFGLQGTHVIDADYSELEDLQVAFQKKVDGVKDMWEITPNQKLELMGYDPSPDELMDKIWIKAGYKLLEDAAINIDNLPPDPMAQQPGK